MQFPTIPKGIRTYLSNAHAPTPDSGTIITTDPNMGVGYVVAQARFGTAGKQIEISDFFTPK